MIQPERPIQPRRRPVEGEADIGALVISPASYPTEGTLRRRLLHARDRAEPPLPTLYLTHYIDDKSGRDKATCLFMRTVERAPKV